MLLWVKFLPLPATFTLGVLSVRLRVYLKCSWVMRAPLLQKQALIFPGC